MDDFFCCCCHFQIVKQCGWESWNLLCPIKYSWNVLKLQNEPFMFVMVSLHLLMKKATHKKKDCIIIFYCFWSTRKNGVLLFVQKSAMWALVLLVICAARNRILNFFLISFLLFALTISSNRRIGLILAIQCVVDVCLWLSACSVKGPKEWGKSLPQNWTVKREIFSFLSVRL